MFKRRTNQCPPDVQAIVIPAESAAESYRISSYYALREIRILRLLSSHKSIIALIDLVPPHNPLNFDTLWVVYEHMPSNLKRILRSNQYFSNLQIEYIMYQILLALKYIHSAGIIHLNLKPSNILIDSLCKIRISDFRSARTIPEYTRTIQDHTHLFDTLRVRGSDYTRYEISRGHAIRPQITKWYLAPEAILLKQNKAHLYALDMWSAGCVFGELLQMNRTNCTDYKQRHALFRGSTCFPHCVDRTFTDYRHRTDQLQTIADLIGTSQITAGMDGLHRKVQIYLQKLRPSAADDSDTKNMSKLFPGTNSSGIALLSTMLKFDPQQRINVRNAMQSEYFDNARDQHAETMHLRFDIWTTRVHFVEAWSRQNIKDCACRSQYVGFKDVCSVISQYVDCDKLISHYVDCQSPYISFKDITEAANEDERTLRAMILDDVMYFNPDWKKELIQGYKRKRKELRRLNSLYNTQH